MKAMETVSDVNTMDALLHCNEDYYRQFISRPFFKVIENGLLNQDEKKKKLFFDYMQIFADYFQEMLQMRQATCKDEKFYAVFLKHFLEELGHNELFQQSNTRKKLWDPILVAVSTWFVHQMQVLDNIEKAVVMHLVLEKGGDFYHSLGDKILSQHIQSNYYQIHAKVDEDHTAMVLELLPGYSASTYQRLNQILKESWSMLYTMVDRVHELVMQSH